MATSTLDLWSDDIQVDVMPPIAVLRAQEYLLAQKTQNILQAQLSVTEGKDEVELGLDLVAPALNGYRARLLTARHDKELIYPVYVTAECFYPDAINSFKRKIASQLRSPLEPPANQRIAATAEEFINLVRSVLRSVEVRSLIQSLIARTNQLKSQAEEPNGEQPKT